MEKKEKTKTSRNLLKFQGRECYKSLFIISIEGEWRFNRHGPMIRMEMQRTYIYFLVHIYRLIRTKQF